MNIGQLLDQFSPESTLQVNIIKPNGALVYIPDPAFYQNNRHWVSMQEIASIPVKSIIIETEEDFEGQPIHILIINQEVDA